MLIPATEVEELRHEGQAMQTKMVEVKHGEPSVPWVVEEPAFLMAAAMPLFSNGLYEGSTWWWRILMSLLMARYCWAEQAVNCLLKARAIAFGLEWVFPSKVIEMFGGGFNLRPPSLCSSYQ